MKPMVAALKARNLDWPIAWAGVELIADKEECRLVAYKNFPREPWTCGWGETSGVTANTRWTQDYADQRFVDSLNEFTEEVRVACTREPNVHELAAMVSLAYNIGLGWKGKRKPAGAKDGFRQSTVLRQHNAGNSANAARAFGLWNKADGKVSNGLVARRAAEAALYLSPVEGGVAAPMPQAVEPESRPITGQIASSAVVTGGTGLVTAIGAMGEQVTTIKTALGNVKGFLAETLGIPPDWILPLVLIVAAGIILRYRYLQRSQGHA